MTIWDKVKEGIDKAGKAAHDVIDDGKTRLDAYRARESADKAAEAFGYALFRAMELGQELDTDSRNRLMQSLRERDADAHRLEAILANEKAADAAAPNAPHSADASSATPPSAPPTQV